MNFNRWQYQGKAEVISTAGETITPDKWLPSIPDFSKKKPWITALLAPYLFFVNTIGAPANAGIDAPDKWAPRTNEIVLKRAENQYLYPFFFFHSEPISAVETITVDKWFIQASEPVRTLKRAAEFDSFEIDWQQLTQAERSTPDKWQPETNKPVFKKPDNRFSYPFLFYDVLSFREVTLDHWFREISRHPGSKERAVDFLPFIIDPTILTQAEIVTFDKWFNQTSLPIWIKPRVVEFPAFFPDPNLFLAPEAVGISSDLILLTARIVRTKNLDSFIGKTKRFSSFIGKTRSFSIER